MSSPENHQPSAGGSVMAIPSVIPREIIAEVKETQRTEQHARFHTLQMLIGHLGMDAQERLYRTTYEQPDGSYSIQTTLSIPGGNDVAKDGLFVAVNTDYSTQDGEAINARFLAMRAYKVRFLDKVIIETPAKVAKRDMSRSNWLIPQGSGPFIHHDKTMNLAELMFWNDKKLPLPRNTVSYEMDLETARTREIRLNSLIGELARITAYDQTEVALVMAPDGM